VYTSKTTLGMNPQRKQTNSVKEQSMKTVHVAELGYNKQTKAIELVVPHGTKTAQIPKIIEGLSVGGLIARLPRGCNSCTSGDHFNVRESLDQVIRVNLETYKAMEE
jgi:hypothetical protein